MIELRAVPSLNPCIPSLEAYNGKILVFNIDNYWRYFPSYDTPSEYIKVIETLADAAFTALEVHSAKHPIAISMDPFGAPWIEWLLPMEGWKVGQLFSPDWDPAVTAYAELFQQGILAQSYTGLCTTHVLQSTLAFCADLVIRNFAPASWIFSNTEIGVSVYFHNTSSIGICVPDLNNYSALVDHLARRGLTMSKHE